MKTTVEIYKRKRGFGFRAKAKNGEIIGTSQTYSRRDSARRGAKRAFPAAKVKEI